MEQALKVYVASSWRCAYQPVAVDALRAAKFEVYDFRNPAPGDKGFHWSEIDCGWQTWSVEKFADVLRYSPIARAGFNFDLKAMREADACLLVLPSGRSAHLEAGWFVGQGKPTCVWIPEPCEPELMLKCLDSIVTNLAEAVRWAIHVAIEKGLRTCPHPGCPLPSTSKPPCALCYE